MGPFILLVDLKEGLMNRIKKNAYFFLFPCLRDQHLLAVLSVCIIHPYCYYTSTRAPVPALPWHAMCEKAQD